MIKAEMRDIMGWHQHEMAPKSNSSQCSGVRARYYRKQTHDEPLCMVPSTQMSDDSCESSLCIASDVLRDASNWLAQAGSSKSRESTRFARVVHIGEWKCDAICFIGTVTDYTITPSEPPISCSYTRFSEEAAAEPASEVSEELEVEFRQLADRWHADTAVLSSITMKSMHPAYQRIIGLGSQVIPLIIRELELRPDHWFWALTAITGDDPITAEDAGDVDRMARVWLEHVGRRDRS